jgi:ubiquinone/menaquinone biosynthesis C-methylase UbiE
MDQADKLFTDGEAYERLMGRWSRLVGVAFLDWLDIPKGLRWLDVGCGNGAFTEELVARSAPAAVVAIDPSEDQLAYARTRTRAEMADFRVGDAQKLAFDDGSFDVAIMALVISFLPNPDKAIAEMTRVVRPGGWVATYMWDIPGGGVPVDPIYVTLESMGITSGRPPNSAISRREAMQELWEKAGLASVETRVIRIPVTYSSFDEFWDSNTVPIGPQGKLIAGMSKAAREQLRTRVRERLPVGSDGRIAYEAFANAVKGRVMSDVGTDV